MATLGRDRFYPFCCLHARLDLPLGRVRLVGAVGELSERELQRVDEELVA
jgi:hypothetical protein